MLSKIYDSSHAKMLAAILFITWIVGIPGASLHAQSTLPQTPSGWPQGIIQIPSQSTAPAAPNSPQAAPNQQPSTPQALLINPPAMTQETDERPSMITQATAIVFISLLPYLVILLTAFIKVAVVMALLRNALGLQQSPPNQVINGLALILSIYVMFPTGVEMYNAGREFITTKAPAELISKDSSAFIIKLVDVTKDPLKQFLARNTSPKHLKSFYQLAYKAMPPDQKATLTETDFLVLVPSYITSQLKDAYEIGVLIYLPFFVIDLVVSNILLAMGMMMLSPLTIALPLKLLLLVMLDGWTLLIQGLILTYK
jgi:type III secretion protein R